MVKKFLLLYPLLAFSFSSYADTFMIKSQPSQVILYQHSAEVTRDVSLTLPAGQHQLIFTDIPASVNPTNIQYNTNDSDLRILAIHNQKDNLTSNSSQPNSIDNQLKTLKLSLQETEHYLSNEKAQQDFLLQLSTQVGSGTLEVKDIQNRYQYIQKTLASKNQRWLQLKEQQAELLNQIKQLQEQASQLNPHAGDTQTITLTVQNSVSRKISFQMTYLVNNASWQPSYEAHYKTNQKTLKLSYSALISQQTGEDWKAVHLTLSTSSPNQRIVLPKLSPWYLEPWVEQPMQISGHHLKGYQPMMLMAESTNKNEKPYQMNFEVTNNKSNITDTTFTINHKTTILSNQGTQKVGISAQEIPIKLQYETWPSLSNAIFITITTDNPFQYPMLPGQMSTYINGKLSAIHPITLIYPKTKLHFNLGKDQSISVDTQPVRKYNETQGILTTDNATSYDYQTTIENHQSESKTILIHQQYPLSEDAAIQIKLMSPDLKTVKVTKPGEFVQSITLPAKQSKTLHLKFMVIHPQKMKIIGLP